MSNDPIQRPAAQVRCNGILDILRGPKFAPYRADGIDRPAVGTPQPEMLNIGVDRELAAPGTQMTACDAIPAVGH